MSNTFDQSIGSSTLGNRVLGGQEIYASKYVSSRTLTGVSRIRKTTNRTESGVARIQITTNKMVTGVSRIGLTTNKAITGLSKISETTQKTITGVANITSAVSGSNDQLIGTTTLGNRVLAGQWIPWQTLANRTIAGVSRIQITTNRTLTGKSYIQLTTNKTLAGKSSVLVMENRTISGVGRLTVTSRKTLTGTANIVKSAIDQVLGGTMLGVRSLAGSRIYTYPSVRSQVIGKNVIGGILVEAKPVVSIS